LWSKKAVAYKVIFGYPYFWRSRKVIENKEFLLLAAKNPPNKILKTYYFYYFQQVFSGRQKNKILIKNQKMNTIIASQYILVNYIMRKILFTELVDIGRSNRFISSTNFLFLPHSIYGINWSVLF
jgi:hypothetical protein